MPGLRLILGAVFLVAGSLLLTSCASHDPDRESDIPWNAPQPWEGSPSIPGLNNR